MARILTPVELPDAAKLLLDGALVAFPTETVYGLGARADDDQAVAAIYQAKGRPSFNPLIVHVPDRAAAEEIAQFDEVADRLSAVFWPGSLTLVLPLRQDAEISPLVLAGHDTVAIRCPALPLARDLLELAGVPIAAPSANISGTISPTRADHVEVGLGDRVAAILDGGPAQVGIESTILSTEPLALLRPGGVPREILEKALGQPVPVAVTKGAPNAPGQLASHYAPKAALRLNAETRDDGELLLGFGKVEDADRNLSPAGEVVEAAANLFAMLRELDQMAAGRPIAVSPLPDHGLGFAINDRLARAAAPRD